MKPQIIELPRGERLAVAEMPWMESVSFGIFVGVGSRHDPARCSGLAHFAEHLFFKGTRRFPARKLSLEIERLGGSADAFTSEEHTCFYIRGPAESFPRFAELLLDMFLDSTFPHEEVEREREVISEEISMYQEQAPSRVEDLLCHTMWPGHPLGRPISGDEASLRRIRREDLVRHARTHYGRANAVLAVAGKVEAVNAAEILSELIARRFPPGRRPAHRLGPRRQFGKGPKWKCERREIEQTQIALAVHAPGRQGTAPQVMKILNVLAGENTSSRLWHQLREKRGWCYQVESEATSLSDTGLFQVFAGVDPTNTAKAVRLIWKELRRFAEKPVPQRDLDHAISYTLGSGRLSFENTASLMLWIGESLLFHGHILSVEESQKRLASVTREQIQRLSQRLFQSGNLGVAIVGPGEPGPVGLEQAG